MEPTPKRHSYWESFVNADIPLWERVLDGAVLPIALPLSLLGLAGCSDDGLDPSSCDSAAATDTRVGFKDGSVSEEEKEPILEQLQSNERTLRRLVPQLFCSFNGWEVTDDLMGATAYYDRGKGKVFVPKYLTANAHEFCHYVSDRHRLLYGKLASETEEWKKLSCFLTGRYKDGIEGCVDHLGNLLRGAEEEFANVCAPAMTNPLGALLAYAGETNTFEQILYVLRVMEIAPHLVEDISKNVLQPAAAVGISGQMETSRLPIPRDIYDPPAVHRLGEGVFGFLWDDHLFRFFKPIEGEAQGWARYDLRSPLDFDSNSPYSVAFQQDVFFLRQNGNLYSLSLGEIGTRSPSIEDLWLPVASSEALQGRGELVFEGDTPMFFKDTGYWLKNSSGEKFFQGYPPEIEAGLQNSDFSFAQQTESGAYFWISGIPNDSGKVSRLYRIDAQTNTLNFSRIFEIPTAIHGTIPQNYKGDWYIIERVDNDKLTKEVPDFVGQYISLNPPVLLRVEDGGRKITPLKILYPEVDPLTLFIGMSSVDQGSWLVSGSRFIGLAAHQWAPAEEVLLFSPAFLSFELAP